MEAGTAVSRVFVVLNPVAGNCTAEDVHHALKRHFAAEVWICEVYETTGQERIADIVRGAIERGCDMVIAAGGDGTVSGAAAALVHTGIPLGIIPVGTANVLARELGIPLALEAACELLAGDHATTYIDVMQVGDRSAVLQIGVGIDSLMIRDTNRSFKRRFGRAAYIWTAVTRFMGHQPRRFTIVADGRRSRPRALQVVVANGGILGTPPFRWGPDIRPDDGQIDVCIISARTALDYLSLAWHLSLNQQHRDRNVRYLSATRSVIINADRSLPVQADGEIIGETPVQVQVVPSALRVAVPAVGRRHVQELAGVSMAGV